VPTVPDHAPNPLYSADMMAYRETAELPLGIDAMASNLDTLVTVFGGSGFLGRSVVRALAKRDYPHPRRGAAAGTGRPFAAAWPGRPNPRRASQFALSDFR